MSKIMPSKVTQTNWIFFARRVKYFLNKLLNQIKNSNRVENLGLNWMILEKNGKKKNLRGHFWELSDELLNRI